MGNLSDDGSRNLDGVIPRKVMTLRRAKLKIAKSADSNYSEGDIVNG